MFLMWLGEQITARGVGNGISLIIFAGIVANLPSALVSTLELGRTGALSTFFIIFFLLVALGVIALVVFVERAQRRIPVQYPKRQVGNRMFGGENTHLPLKLNTAGVIPPIFASSLLLLPATVAGFATDRRTPDPGCDDRQPAGAWPAAVHGAVPGADHLLRLLLHGRGVQPAGDGGQPEEVWRLRPRHPPGPARRPTISTGC